MAERSAGQVEWLHRDLVSSTRAVSDASGAITQRFDYEPFGKEYQTTGKRPTLGYRAEHFDEETGLVLLGARYYHPEIGRFISADSIIPDIENTQAHDRYAYAFNSPIELIDPTGHAPRSANDAQQRQISDQKKTDSSDDEREARRRRLKQEYCKDHPDEERCYDPSGGMQPINVKVDPLLSARGVRGMTPKQQEEWNLKTEAVSLATRFWNLVNTGTWTEQAVLEVGEETGMNSWARAGTGEDILSHKLSLEQRIDEGIDATGKTLETGATIMAAVEVGTELLAKEGAAAATEGAAESAVCSGGACFAKGTPVLTPSGYQPIEAIRAGDWVYAYSLEQQAPTLRQVLGTSVRQSPTIALEFSGLAGGAGASLRATTEHPFLLCDSRWVEAAILRPGDCVVTATGVATVLSSTASDRIETVYNFVVEADHDYFVGELAVAVHNGCCGRGTNITSGAKQGREFRTDWLEVNQFDPKQPSHVRGWLKNESRRVELGNATAPRNPPGYVQAHGRTTPAREGFDYSNSRLQGADLNRLEESVRRRNGVP